MAYPLKPTINSSRLATALGLEHLGREVEINSVGSLSDVLAGCLVFSGKELDDVVVGGVYIGRPRGSQSFDFDACVLISQSPRLDFMKALQWLHDQHLFLIEGVPPQIHSSAKIGRNVVIEENCVIAEDVEIEPNVVILRGTKIGKKSRIRANSTIGSDGFGFERLSDGSVLRFIHLGGVSIGENVEIGANTCISRGTLKDTVIEDHAKIDNLVHVAHNVHISRGAMLIAGCEVSGGCVVGENSWVGPNACVIEKVSIGDGALVGIGSTVIRSVPPGEIHAGNPAKFLRKTN
jgi:acetyltransferase-like isoleucine patch superfamily enzyme